MYTPEQREQAERNLDLLEQHCIQVEQGLIPADSPPTFIRPEGDDALDERGLPWWFGPGYHPTPEALESFSDRPRLSREAFDHVDRMAGQAMAYEETVEAGEVPFISN